MAIIPVYTGESNQLNDNLPSIYLAGPTVRVKKNSILAVSWRSTALSLLRDYGFNGVVYIPEYRDGKIPENWNLYKQVTWGVQFLNKARIILFWIPRDLKDLPGFTTNIEFGEFLTSGKITIGSPPNAPKMGYLKVRCDMEGIRWFDTLDELVLNTVNKL